MTGWPVPASPAAHVQVSALRTAFPGYTFNLLRHWGEKPRIEALSRDGGSPYCLISDDATRDMARAAGQGLTDSHMHRAGGCFAARAGQAQVPGTGARGGRPPSRVARHLPAGHGKS